MYNQSMKEKKSGDISYIYFHQIVAEQSENSYSIENEIKKIGLEAAPYWNSNKFLKKLMQTLKFEFIIVIRNFNCGY